MYRHLIVPLDDSPLSVETVGRAVDLARTLGARVTFFHARADYGATSDGALERVMSPAEFNENVAGESNVEGDSNGAGSGAAKLGAANGDSTISCCWTGADSHGDAGGSNSRVTGRP